MSGAPSGSLQDPDWDELGAFDEDAEDYGALPPLVKQYGAIVLCQALFWRWVLDERAMPIRMIANWVRRRPDRMQAVVANSVPQFSAYGMASDDPETLLLAWVPINCWVPLHHALGAGCALLATHYGSAAWCRVAISFEVGEDVLHYAQMAWTACFPQRGVVPWKYLDRMAWSFVAVHHLIGLCAGSAAFLTEVVAWEEVQRFIALLLVAGLPCALKAPFEMVQDLSVPSYTGRALAVIETCALLFLVWVRLVLYFPAVISLLNRAFDEIGIVPGYLYGMVLLGVGSVFNLASVALYAPTVIQRVRQQCAPIKKHVD